jgi:hypothetical protein
MNRVPTSLGIRVILFVALRELIPFYALYAVLFGDSGLSVGEISSLLIIWSVVAVILEVPSGAWADTVSRRGLLVLSAVLYAAGFSLWIVAPTYVGFAAGFVLWGASGALMSGTTEALVYDELAIAGATEGYAGLMGWAQSAAMACTLIATLAAAPLFSAGGYPLVGWISVAVALLQGLIAVSLPSAPRVAEADELIADELLTSKDGTGAGGTLRADSGTGRTPSTDSGTGRTPSTDSRTGEPEADEPRKGIAERYLAMLRAGLAEVSRHRLVRHAVLVISLVMGLSVFDEYFSLLAREQGAATTVIPLLVGITSAGEVLGTALAGRTAGMPNLAMAAAMVAAALFFATGAVYGGVLGFAGLAVASGIYHNVIIVSEARLQDAITGPARATVTSVNGLFTEVVAVSAVTLCAIGAAWLSVALLIVTLAIPLALAALLVPRWMPPPHRPTPPTGRPALSSD